MDNPRVYSHTFGYLQEYLDMSMESMTIHAAGFTRRYPASIQVASIGWMPQKRAVIDSLFYSYNFSLILSGSGTYRLGNQDIPIEAPAVITQRPQVHMYYGPHEQWSELFFIFPPAFINLLRAEKLWQDDSWWWPWRIFHHFSMKLMHCLP